MKVAFATCAAFPDGVPDDRAAARPLDAAFAVWNDPAVDWRAYDRVVLRSTWDYSWQSDTFLAWCRAVGPRRLRNPPELVAFNADKRYLGRLSVPVVTTTFVAPGEDIPALSGEVVVKPNVSAGARDTGRFGPGQHAGAAALITRIHASGKVGLIQPYLPAVEDLGETAVVYIGGEPSHVLTKRAVLRGRGIAPVGDHPLGVAATMLEDDLVTAGAADEAQCALAAAVHAEIAARFGTPLYLRIDLVAGPGGAPVLLELEAIEPSLYLDLAPDSAERLAAAIRAS